MVVATIVLVVTAVAVLAWQQFRTPGAAPWTDAERTILRSLWLNSLPPPPADPSNAVADDPRAADFGYRLFFDTRLSSNNAISCATCHQPERRFTDGLARGQALGTSKRNTLSIVGVVYSPWLYWDGRRDSLWSQALSPLEDPAEHGGDRQQFAQLIADDPDYRRRYEELFGDFPNLPDAAAVDRIFANVGKTIAAYERLLLPAPSRFDDYVAALVAGEPESATTILSPDERRGLQLFIGEGACIQCHNGPLFTNHEFHNTGVLSFPGELPDKGRAVGVREVRADPFNCRGAYSDDAAKRCDELEFARTGADILGAVRTPSLRNLDSTAPYMHKGQLATLGAVLRHYNEAPLAMIGHSEAKPLGLSKRELRQLEAFLGTLAAPLATADKWLTRPQPRLAADAAGSPP